MNLSFEYINNFTKNVMIIMISFVCFFSSVALQANETPNSNIFLVENINVSSVAEDAVAARKNAISKAQNQAFNLLMKSMIDPRNLARIPELSDESIANMVASMEVRNEKISRDSYSANISVLFNSSSIKQLLSSLNLKFADSSSPPIIVIPVLNYETPEGQKISLLWQPNNLWLKSWQENSKYSSVNFIIPNSEVMRTQSNVTAANAKKLLYGDFQNILDTYNANEVLIADAHLEDAGDGINNILNIEYLQIGKIKRKSSFENVILPKEQGFDMLFTEGVQLIANNLQSDWVMSNNAENSLDQIQKITILVPLDSLQKFVNIRRKINNIPMIEKYHLAAISPLQADLHLYLKGNPNQIFSELESKGLMLQQVNESWVLNEMANVSNQGIW